MEYEYSIYAHFVLKSKDKQDREEKKASEVIYIKTASEKVVKMNFKLPYAFISISLITCLSPFIAYIYLLLSLL